MKKVLRIFLATVTAVALLFSTQLTAFAVGGGSRANLFWQLKQVQQQVPARNAPLQHSVGQNRIAKQRPQPPQASQQAQDAASRAKAAIGQTGLVAPDIRHQPPTTARDSSLASTTYAGITVSLYDSKVSEDTLLDITDALADIPDMLLDEFSGDIYIVSDIRNVASNASADAIGMFVTTGDIYIEEWCGYEDTYLRTLAHELGHNLDWQLGLSAGYSSFMTESDSDWIALWKAFPTYRSAEGSLYSTVSIQEWFAEIVADYVCYPDYEKTYYPEIYDAVDILF